MKVDDHIKDRGIVRGDMWSPWTEYFAYGCKWVKVVIGTELSPEELVGDILSAESHGIVVTNFCEKTIKFPRVRGKEAGSWQSTQADHTTTASEERPGDQCISGIEFRDRYMSERQDDTLLCEHYPKINKLLVRDRTRALSLTELSFIKDIAGNGPDRA